MASAAPQLDTQALISAARDGDRAALERLLAAEQARIYSFGLKMCRNGEDARDIVQDTMFAVARGISGFRGDAAFSTWLFQIARSFCIKKRRARKGAPKHTEALDHVPESALTDATPSPEQTARGKELETLLNEGLATLPVAAREVIVLRDVEGLTAPEVAQVLGISVDAVKSKLHRARASLHKALAPRLDPATTSTGQCPDILAMYSRQLEGDLNGALCAKLEAHVAECPRCAGTCDALKKSLAVCKTLVVVPDEVQAAVRTSLEQFVAIARR